MWWLMWVAVIGVVAAVLLIAYLADRRGSTGSGMTDRDRNNADRIARGHENRAEPWAGPWIIPEPITRPGPLVADVSDTGSGLTSRSAGGRLGPGDGRWSCWAGCRNPLGAAGRSAGGGPFDQPAQ